MLKSDAVIVIHVGNNVGNIGDDVSCLFFAEFDACTAQIRCTIKLCVAIARCLKVHGAHHDAAFAGLVKIKAFIIVAVERAVDHRGVQVAIASFIDVKAIIGVVQVKRAVVIEAAADDFDCDITCTRLVYFQSIGAITTEL